jgi:hypothetical protein
MSFGLRNTAQTYQCFMDNTLRGLNFCSAYLDDIVFSRSLTEHEQHLRVLFARLRSNGILINPSKCVFRASELDFLGYNISAAGSRPLHSRVEDLLACSPPKTVGQLRRFLGMLNFYHRFLPHAAALQAPLYDILSGLKVKNSHPFLDPPTPSNIRGLQG